MTPPPSTEGLIERVETWLNKAKADYKSPTVLTAITMKVADIEALIALARPVPEGPPDDVLVERLAHILAHNEPSLWQSYLPEAKRIIEALALCAAALRARSTQPGDRLGRDD